MAQPRELDLEGAVRSLCKQAEPMMGLTLNFAHPACTYALLAIALLPVVITAAMRLVPA